MANPAPSSVTETPASPQVYVKKSQTNWDALGRCGLVPIRIDCQAYHPVHLADQSCHTRLRTFDADSLKRHADAEHGGGFEVYLKRADGKASPLWPSLSAACVEATDFRCGTCSKPLRFSPASLLEHMKQHAGDTRLAYKQIIADKPACVGMIRLTIGSFLPDSQVDDFADEQ